MDPMIIGTLAGKLAEKLAVQLMSELPGRIRRVLEGDPEKCAALRRAFQAGIESALKEMRAPSRERLERYEAVLTHWLQLPQVVEELGKLVDVGAVLDDPTRAVNLSRLDAIFKASYPVTENRDAYIGLNFPAALRAFVRAYADAVERQADKFPWIQTGLLKELIARTDERPRASTVREIYLVRLAEDCDLLPLSAYSAKEAAPGTPAKATLREVYVPLQVLLPPAEKERKGFLARLLGGDKAQPIPEELAGVAREERGAALRVITEKSRVVLLGDPGSGKTTLTNHLALCLAMHQLDPAAGWLERLEDWAVGPLLPVRVELRQFAARTIQTDAAPGYAALLWNFIEDEAKRHGYTEFFPALRAELLERGGVLILDGLDEVPDAAGRRQCVQEAIMDFIRTAKKCRVIVTCRTYAYPATRLEGFDAYPLLPFQPEQINLFIDRWYDAVRPKERWTQTEAAERAATLKSAVDVNRRAALADLATRPLLLTLMAMLHASEGKLPEDRADLYEKCVELLLDYWQQRKAVRNEQTGQIEIEGGLMEKVGIEKAALKRALFRIAFEAHDHQGSGAQRSARTADIQPAELEAVLKPTLGSDEKYRTALRYIQERAGLIYWRDPTFTFPHRSFQEYLAACHLGNFADPVEKTRTLVEKDLEWWREVYLLQVGRQRANLGTALAFVNHLCPESPPAAPTLLQWQIAILTGQALDELHLPAQIEEKRRQGEPVAPFEAPLNRVRAWLHALVETTTLTPRERAQAGLTLGALGDPRHLEELCHLPAGEFGMGEDKEAHKVAVGEFWIAKYPVTCAQYRAFMDAGGYAKTEYWKTKAARAWVARSKGKPVYWDDPRWNQPTLPVVGVSWFEANAYCEWLTEQIANSGLRIAETAAEFAIRNSKFVIRLPTEAEWEKAATWDTVKQKKNTWPWGDTFDPAKANTAEGDDRIGSTTSVGIYPHGASPCGARDMSGNVWEWCSTLYQDYPYCLDAKHESPDAEGARVLRGGSWSSSLVYARGAVRGWYLPDLWYYDLGFRVVVASSLKF